MMLDLSLLQNKTIVILGAGITGLSCARFLHKHHIAFSVNDSRAKAISEKAFAAEFAGNHLSQGQWDKALIASADILLVSPGIHWQVPEIQSHIAPHCQVFGDVELFCRLTNIPTIAVTGSNGKSTVVTLLAFLGEKLGFNTRLAGNIGVPVLDNIEQAADFIVLELSSFQLETLSNMQALSASVLNVCDDHLDRHETLENYQNIKLKIYQQAQTRVINRDDARTWPANYPAEQAGIVSFGLDKPAQGHFGLAQINDQLTLMYGEQALISVAELPIAGVHNALNCLAALALGQAAGWSLTEMVKYLSAFKGLDHRCQQVPSTDGIVWVNDSKATNVGATIAAINGFAANKQAEKIYLIAGGDAKGADVSELIEPIKQHIEHVFTFGKDGDKIAAVCHSVTAVADLQAAVAGARALAKAGDIVLLSPACASLDMFKNYMERGLKFQEAVQGGQA